MATADANMNPRPLIGEEISLVDDKGRLSMSKAKRERLGDNFALVLGAMGCLEAYPLLAWLKMFDEIERHPMLSEAKRTFERMLRGTAVDDLSFDTQGRVVIPQSLREAAKIRGGVKIIGCGNRVEIWSIERWEQFSEDVEKFSTPRSRKMAAAYEQMTGQASAPAVSAVDA
jgi:MraZ protein